MKIACLGLVFAAWCLAQPSSPEQPAISGTVTNASGQPLRRVIVQLSPMPYGLGPSTDVTGTSAATETDSQGNFVFEEAVPGRYMLRAERSGYLTTPYLSPRGGPLLIEAGKRATDIVIKVFPQGIIAGRVLDDENEPLAGTTVTIRVYSPSGKRPQIEPPPSTGTTNADGAFAIGSLLPGKYVVSVTAPSSTGPPLKLPSGSRPSVYVSTYYPDATDFDGATPVNVEAGGDVRGIEIRLQKVPVFNIKGKVVDAETGEPVPIDGLVLFRRGGGPLGLSARSTGVKAGEFSFDGIVPGDYILETKPSASGEHALVGREVISVGNGDLDSVVVEVKPAIEVRGKIIVEGSSIATWPQITLTPIEGLNYPDFAAIGDDGRFAVNGLEPAPYVVNIAAMTPPWFIKTVRFNGHELHGDPIDLSGSSASLEVVISDRASSVISGVVTDSDAPVGPGITIFAVRNAAPSPTPLRLPMARTDQNGHFSLSRVPPGDYVLVAVDAAGFPIFPPEVLDRLGKSVSVGDGDSVTADLRLTTPADVRAADPN